MFPVRWRGQPRPSAATAEVVRQSDRPVVVTALALKASAREHLARSLGDVEVRDIRDDVLTADLVLAPSCSPQAIAALKRAFPVARLLVVELEDGEWDVHLSGPVQRLLAAGADAYLTADSIVDLSDQIRLGKEQPAVAAQEQTALEEPSVDELILANVADLIRRRTETTVVVRREVDR
jgi:hypothetical protein